MHVCIGKLTKDKENKNEKPSVLHAVGDFFFKPKSSTGNFPSMFISLNEKKHRRHLQLILF